jgi:hypothetical protein
MAGETCSISSSRVILAISTDVDEPVFSLWRVSGRVGCVSYHFWSSQRVLRGCMVLSCA